MRSQLRGARGPGPAWAGEGAVGWIGTERPGAGSYFTALGTPAEAARLLTAVATQVLAALPTPRVSLPRGTVAALPAAYRVDDPVDWDFRWTGSAPPVTAGESLVEWLDSPVDDPAVTELLELASPRTSARPGNPAVRRWAGIRGPDGRLDACAGDTSGAPVGHLSAIATRPECRGSGLGTGISARLTRQLLTEFDLVTLGVYADNPAGLRLYDRLGYADDHHFTSGLLHRS